MVPSGKVLPGADPVVWVSVTEPELSVAVGAVQLANAPEGPVASIVWFAGQALMTGASLSVTVTMKLVTVGPLPAASVAVYVTVVVPIGNAKLVSDAAGTGTAVAAPDKATVKLVTPTLSEAVGGVQL